MGEVLRQTTGETVTEINFPVTSRRLAGAKINMASVEISYLCSPSAEASER